MKKNETCKPIDYFYIFDHIIREQLTKVNSSIKTKFHQESLIINNIGNAEYDDFFLVKVILFNLI